MTADPIQAPYGRWQSRIQPETFADLRAVSEPVHGPGGHLAWIEATADGRRIRTVLAGGRAGPELAGGHAPGGRVGYGGGAFTLGRETAFFVDRGSGQLFRQPLIGGPARPIIPAFGGAASPTVSPDGRWLLYVHTDGEIDSLALVSTEGSAWPVQLAHGPGFFMQPAWHPDGRRIAWVSWEHPHMPWDRTELHQATLDLTQGWPPVLGGIEVVAGGPNGSAFQPAFSPNGASLAYLSDHEGFYTLYMRDLANGDVRRIFKGDQCCGGPPWVQGMRFFDFSLDGRTIYAILNDNGVDTLWRLQIADGSLSPIPLPDDLALLSQVTARWDGEGAAFLASGVVAPPGIYRWSPETGVRHAGGPSEPPLPTDQFSRPRSLDWSGEDGETVHGLYYPPHNPGYTADGLPPLVVSIHGGPTSQARAEFDPRLQFLTSRGYAVLAVNYRGSSGYGRAYRQALYGHWGVLDVADVVSGADHVSREGLADPAAVFLLGSSAGGFTALMALARNPGRFRGAICRYPVTQHPLEPTGHKFERFFNHSLLGPLPESEALYRKRSPLAQADKIKDPVLIFHGDTDPVVPERHSAELVARLRANRVPCGYIVFEGEGHGFGQPETWEAYYRLVARFLREAVPPTETR